jgi:hypothetical protein
LNVYRKPARNKCGRNICTRTRTKEAKEVRAKY